MCHTDFTCDINCDFELNTGIHIIRLFTTTITDIITNKDTTAGTFLIVILFPLFIAIAIITTGYDVTHCSICRHNKVGIDNDIINTTDKVANDGDDIVALIDESATTDAKNTMVLLLLLTYLSIVKTYTTLRLFQMTLSMP